MSDSNFKVSFDFQGAMRSLGRWTRKGYDTVKEKAADWESDEDEAEQGGKREKSSDE